MPDKSSDEMNFEIIGGPEKDSILRALGTGEELEFTLKRADGEEQDVMATVIRVDFIDDQSSRVSGNVIMTCEDPFLTEYVELSIVNLLATYNTSKGTGTSAIVAMDTRDLAQEE